MIGSPLNIVSYSLDSSKVSKRDQDLSQLQAYRAYYQSLKGDIKEVIMSGSSWQTAKYVMSFITFIGEHRAAIMIGCLSNFIVRANNFQSPIFTDALNNTGLASLSYLNGSEQQVGLLHHYLDPLLKP